MKNYILKLRWDRLNQKTLNKVSIRLVNDVPLVSESSLSTPEKAVEIVADYIKGMDREVLSVINLNAKLQPINFSIISIGAVDQTLAVPRDVLKSAILSNAAHMMVMHNHPSSNLTPSREDVKMTSRLIDICELVGIPLVDHIIVGPKNKDYFSMRLQDAVNFKSDIKYADKLEFLNFKSSDNVKVAERDNRSSR